MSIEKAKKHYLGKDNHEKLDCAKSILKAFEHLDKGTSESICKGGGRAPNGECGAICAAKALLNNQDKSQALDKLFIEIAGSSKCHEIRMARKLSCLGCVEKAAEFLHNNIK